MVVAHGHFPTLAPLLEGPLCLVEEEVGTFSHWLGLHGGESPWLAVSKSGAPHSLAARCPLLDGQPTSKVLQSHTNIGALPSLQLCRILQRIAMAFLLMAHGVVRKAL